jgi:hypothetical protein
MTDAITGVGGYPMVPDEGESLEDFRLRQKRHAQKQAVAARQRIAAFKQAIRDGQIDDLALVRGDLSQFEVLISNWPVDRLILVCNDIGRARLIEILMQSRLPSPRTRVNKLSYAQRAKLAKLIHAARDPIGAVLEEQQP